MKTLKELVNVIIFALLVLVLGSLFSYAYGKVQTFELEKPMEERVFLCLERDVLDPMLDAAIKKDQETLQMLSYVAQVTGKCGVVQVQIVYKKLLKEAKDDDGNLFTIYEAVVDGITVYVPLRNYRHRGDV